MPRKIYNIIHEYDADDTEHGCNDHENSSGKTANLPVPLRTGPYSTVNKHVHARNSAAFITQLLETKRQNEMLHGRFERSAKRAGRAYSQAACLFISTTRARKTKQVFI